MSETALTRIAAEIQMIVEPMGSKEVAERTLRPLNNLPGDEIRKQIWDEVTAENEKVTAVKVQEAVNEWRLKHESLQNDLIAKTQQALVSHKVRIHI